LPRDQWGHGTDTFIATIRFPNGATQQVQIEADDTFKAKMMLEAQYGKGSVYTGPIRKPS
jgi:hypothetical protein